MSNVNIHAQIGTTIRPARRAALALTGKTPRDPRVVRVPRPTVSHCVIATTTLPARWVGLALTGKIPAVRAAARARRQTVASVIVQTGNTVHIGRAVLRERNGYLKTCLDSGGSTLFQHQEKLLKISFSWC